MKQFLRGLQQHLDDVRYADTLGDVLLLRLGVAGQRPQCTGSLLSHFRENVLEARTDKNKSLQCRVFWFLRTNEYPTQRILHNLTACESLADEQCIHHNAKPRSSRRAQADSGGSSAECLKVGFEADSLVVICSHPKTHLFSERFRPTCLRTFLFLFKSVICWRTP